MFVGGQQWFDTYFQHLLTPLLFYYVISSELNKINKIVSQEYDLGENYEKDLKRKIKRMMDLKEPREIASGDHF